MNKPQNSIVLFLQFVMEKENSIILLNFRSLAFIAERSLLQNTVLISAMKERDWWP